MAMRFCSECGARLKVGRASLPQFLSFCPSCRPGFARIRLMLIGTPVLFAAIGFVVGHYTSAREPFYFIGTPVDLTANGARSAEANHHSTPGSGTPAEPQPAISPGEADAVCGARTKSGKPCKRKVKGGGYCWQHRSGQPPKKEEAAER